jgi:hypothetical protein
MAVALGAAFGVVSGRVGRKARPAVVARLFWPFYKLADGAVVDGLGLFNTELRHLSHPHIEKLSVALRAGAEAGPGLEEGRGILEHSARTVRRPPSASPYVVAGWVADPGVATVLGGYIPEPGAFANPAPGVVLGPRITKDAAAAALETLPRLFSGQSRAELETIRSTAALVRRRTGQWLDDLDTERVLASDRLSRTLAEAREAAEQLIGEGRAALATELEEIEQRFLPEITAHEAEAARWEQQEKGWRERGAGNEASIAAAKKARRRAEDRRRTSLARRDRERARAALRCSAVVDRAWERVMDQEVRGLQDMESLDRLQQEVARLGATLERDLLAVADRAARPNHAGSPSGPSASGGLSAEAAEIHVPVVVIAAEAAAHPFILTPRALHQRGPLGIPLVRLRGRDGAFRRFSSTLHRVLSEAVLEDATLREEIMAKARQENILGEPGTREAYERGLRYLAQRRLGAGTYRAGAALFSSPAGAPAAGT